MGGGGNQLQKLLKDHRIQVPFYETEEGICLLRSNVHLQAYINKGTCSLCTFGNFYHWLILPL